MGPYQFEWVVAALAIASPIFTAGVVYGLLRGRLALIEYRLTLIEKALEKLGFTFGGRRGTDRL